MKTHPQWKHEGFTMILRSTTSSLNLANVSASSGLANSAIIPTDQNQMIEELGFCENTGQWRQRCQRKIPDEAPTTLGQLTSGSRTDLRGTRLTGSPRLRKDWPTPLPSDEYGTIFLTWERLSAASNHRVSQGGENKPVLRQVSTDVCKHRVWQQGKDSVRTSYC